MKEYVEEFYEITETSEKVFISMDFPDGYAKYGWYRYDVRFALPAYDDKTGQAIRYNIFSVRMLVRYAEDGKKYLYDLLAIKKETSSPLEP